MSSPANTPTVRVESVRREASGTEKPRGAAPAGSPDIAKGLAQLLQYEADMRRTSSVVELTYFLANETRRILPYEQMFVLREAQIGQALQVKAASSIAAVDRNAPLIRAVEAVVADCIREADTGADTGLGAVEGALPEGQARKAEVSHRGRSIDIRTLNGDAYEALEEYPFAYWMWHPMLDAEGQVFGGLLAASSQPASERESKRLERVAETGAHAWRALTHNRPVRRIPALDKRQKCGFAIMFAVIALFPVRMNALAPAEIVAVRPFVISAPFEGVIQRIEVAPYTKVHKGQVLVTFDDVRLRNELEVAQERLAVARAKIERASSAAVADTANESRDVAIMRAEYREAQAMHAYAKDMLERSRITAPRDAVAIFTDRREWEGRAVTTGQPVMQIADPKAVELRIDLPSRAQMDLRQGDWVSLWLDSQPLWALQGKLTRISYQAQPTVDGVLSFSLTAKLLQGTPQIGSRGTARVNGRWVPFAYSVFKRPIATVRQTIGL